MVAQTSASIQPTEVRTMLLAGVADIADTLRSAIDDEERNAELSRTSSDALYESGVLRMKLPRCLGGFEADLVTQFEVIEALAAINSAAAWCAMVGATSLAMPGAFLPQAGIDKMFAGGHIPRGAILIMPTGQAIPCEGGYHLTGRWAFASGVQHAEWIAAHGIVPQADGTPPELRMLVFPGSSIKTHDNWQVLGLRGTGSCDISVDKLFVPDDLTWAAATQLPRRGGPLYGLGVPAFVAYEHAAFAVGLARGALDLLSELVVRKKRSYGPGASSLAERQTVQRAVGRHELQLRAARALAVELNQQAMDVINDGAKIDTRLSVELRAVAVYCTEVASEIISEAFRYAGAGAIFEHHRLQRSLRDINVAAQHLMVSDIAYELLGRLSFGFADVNPMD